MPFRDEHWEGEPPLFRLWLATRALKCLIMKGTERAYLEPMYSRIVVVLSCQPSATVERHECDQIDGHPALWLVVQDDLLEVFKNFLSKWLEETDRQNHVQLLDHDGWQGNLSKQWIRSIGCFWYHIECVITVNVLGGSGAPDRKPQSEEVSQNNTLLFRLFLVS